MRYILAILLCLMSLPVCAYTLNVNGSTGNDSATYAQVAAGTHTWRTLARAAWGSTDQGNPNASEAARAGDTVILAPGTYTVSGLTSPETGHRHDPIYNPVNSGTSGSPIIFKAQYPAISASEAQRTILQGNTGGIGQPIIGALSRTYITWDGFYLDEANINTTADTGPVVFAGATGGTVQNCIIVGAGVLWPDNHVGVRVDQSYNTTIRNNKISNIKTTGVNQSNGAGIQVYDSDGLTIENNEIYDCGSGVFLKAFQMYEPIGPGLIIIRYNLLHSMDHTGIIAHRASATVDEPIKIYQNVIYSCPTGFRIWAWDLTGTDPMNVKFVNNTIDGSSIDAIFVSGNLISDANNIVWNNIISNTTDRAVNYAGSTSNLTESRYDSEHNVYYAHGTYHSIVYYTSYSLAGWKSTYGQDSATPEAISDNPLYVDRTARDYKLQSGSPALTLGRTIAVIHGSSGSTIPAGAYITGNEVIGVDTSGGSTPSIPGGVVISGGTVR